MFGFSFSQFFNDQDEFTEDFKLFDTKLALCTIACLFSGFALIYDYFIAPFPKSTNVLMMCSIRCVVQYQCAYAYSGMTRMSLYACVTVYVCTYVCTVCYCIRMYICVYCVLLYTYVHTCVLCVTVYVCTYVCTVCYCIRMYICVYCVLLYTYVHMCVLCVTVYVCTYVCTVCYCM